MTVSTSVNKFRYEGNGVTSVFAFSGRIFNASDLIVEIIDRATDELLDTLTITTDYTVTINSDESASITVLGGNIPASDEDILIRRDLSKTQTVDLPTGTVFPAVNVENALDRLTAIIQDVQEQVDRKIGIPVTDSDAVPDLAGIVSDAEAAQVAAEAAQVAAEAAEVSAEAAAVTAVAAAAGVSLPSLGTADTVLQVNAGGTALEYGKIAAENISDPELLALAGLTSAADTVPVFTGSGTAALVTLAASQILARGASGNVTNCTLGTSLAFAAAVLNTVNATQADQETATSTTALVTPGVQQYHPSACKAWIKYTSITSTAITASYNITSVSDNGTGDTTITIATDFSSANFAAAAIAAIPGTSANFSAGGNRDANSVGSYRIQVYTTTNTITDTEVGAVFFGDQ